MALDLSIRLLGRRGEHLDREERDSDVALRVVAGPAQHDQIRLVDVEPVDHDIHGGRQGQVGAHECEQALVEAAFEAFP